MKVILRQDFEQLGNMGDIVDVKQGYARNYLIPKGIALVANNQNLNRLKEEQRQASFRKDRDRHNAEHLAEELGKVSLTASVKVGEEDKVFGSVTSQDIANLLKDKGHEVDKKKIHLTEPIKALGIYDVPIKLHPEVEAKVKLWVVKE